MAEAEIAKWCYVASWCVLEEGAMADITYSEKSGKMNMASVHLYLTKHL